MGMIACAEKLGTGPDAAAGTATGTSSRAPTPAGTRSGNKPLARRLGAGQGTLERLARVGLGTGQDLCQEGVGDRVTRRPLRFRPVGRWNASDPARSPYPTRTTTTVASGTRACSPVCS